MSRCPLVTGSNEPGQTTRRTRTHAPVDDGCRRPVACGATVPERGFAVTAGPVRRVPGGPGERAGPGGALDHDQRAGREPAVVAQRGRASAATSSSPTCVRRVGEHQVPRRRSPGPGPAPARPGRCTSRAPGRPHRLDVALITAGGRGVGLDQQHVGRAPGQRLQADRARARVQVEDRRPVQAAADRQHGREQALPRPVAGRPGRPAGRHGEPPAAGRARDDPRHRVRLRPSPGTRPARASSSAPTAAASAGSPASAGSAVDELGRPRAAACADQLLVVEQRAAASGWTGGPPGRRRARRPPGAARGRAGTARSRPGWRPPRPAAAAAGPSAAASVTSRHSPACRRGRPGRAAGAAGRRRTGRRP